MAYEGGYGGQRPYPPPGQRMPPPREPYQPGPAQQYGSQSQQYPPGPNDYGYEPRDSGRYGQEQGGQYPVNGQARGPLQNQDYSRRDPYGPGAGRVGQFPGRASSNGPPGRGLIQAQYDRPQYPSAPGNRQRLPDQGPRSPTGPGGYGDFYSGSYNQQGGADYAPDEQLRHRMAGMDLSGDQNMAPSRDAQTHHQQGYMEPRRGPAPPRGFGAAYRTDEMGANALESNSLHNHEFGPPGRSMTMPTYNDPMAPGPLQRTGTMPLNAGQERNPVPQRPSTSHSNRPPPQRTYPAEPPLPMNQTSGRGHNQQYPDRQDSVGNVLDSYYGQSHTNSSEFARHPTSIHSDHGLAYNGYGDPRGSLDRDVRPSMPEQAYPGPHRTAELNRTKSQPDLRQPPNVAYGPAGDAPPMPPLDNARHASLQGSSYGPPPLGMSRPGQSSGSLASRNSNPDSLPSHPTPVRPGHMAGSTASVNDRPAPVRNYNGATPPAVRPQPQPVPNQRSSQTSMTRAKVPVTNEELEQLRMSVKNDPNDQQTALRLAKRLIEAADVLVPGNQDPRARGRARERYLVDANKILKKLSNAQNLDAMFTYADSLGRGLFSAEPDNKEAFTLYQSAAKLGHAAAAYRTAVCCEIGNDEGGGTRKDPLKAIQWYKRAATLGDTPAMYKMGMILLKGLLGQPKNPREAVSWLKRAAERADVDNPHALHELGLLYESAQPNDVIIRDDEYAFQLFRQAADLGYKFSQFRLGCAYEFGLVGCPIDPRQSIAWYSKAATQEEHQSELALSGWYLTGSEGVLQQSDTEAYLWARKAAIAGLAKAEYAMGYFTEVGIGTAANLEDAKRWYWRAASQDFPKARERLEDLKRKGPTGPRQRERVSRTKLGKQQEVFR